MARTNNLSNFLTDVAGAIKEKKGDNTNILAANFDTEILALPSQGVYQNKQLNITTNGNYDVTPDEGYDAMDRLRLSVEIEGKEVKPNIYAQVTEPTSKDGIWLQTNKTAEHYISDDNIFIGGTWSNAGDTASVPYTFYDGGAVTIGTDIYLFGGAGYYTNNYKYNTLTNTYTKLSDIPYDFRRGSVVAINTNIYILGGQRRL